MVYLVTGGGSSELGHVEHSLQFAPPPRRLTVWLLCEVLQPTTCPGARVLTPIHTHVQ